MPDSPVSLSAINVAVQDVVRALDSRSVHALRWQELPEKQLWRELVACILGSRVRYSIAFRSLENLANAGLLAVPDTVADFTEFERKVLDILSRREESYPFARAKGNQIRGAAEGLYGTGGTISGLLERLGEPREARRVLATTVAGLGPKQSSLYLRNIGFANNVAILDSHVLTYMNWFGLAELPTPYIRSLGEYEALESTFIEHSRYVGHPPEQFDLAVWVVVRTAKREFG